MAGVRRLVGVLVLVGVAGLLAASPGLSSSGAPVTVSAGFGSGAVLGAAAGHAAAIQSVNLLPGLSTAQIARIPVAPGPAVPVTVSGEMMSVQATTGKKYCYDAFYANVGAGCTSWTGNGGSNGIWVGPPGWTGSITGVSHLESLNASGTPAFNLNHIYHLTLNLTGKQLLWAIPHGAAGKDTWSGGFTLDFTGTLASGGGTVAVKVLPTPAGFGQTVTGTVLLGGVGVVSSPNIGDLRGLLSTDLRGVTPDDLVIAAARKQCYVNFTHGLAQSLRIATPEKIKAIEDSFSTLLISARLGIATGVAGFDQLGACLAYADAVEAALPGTQHSVEQAAAAASSSCAMSPITLSLSGSGAATRLKSFKVGGPSVLRTSCTSSPGGLSISIAAKSAGTPLRSIVGSNLRLAIVRSKKGSPGGQLRVVFNQGSSTSGPPDITGSWANKQAPTVGPPWQLTTSNGGQTLDATWTGGPGHSGLHGTFHGTLTQTNGTSAYTGTFHITEASTTVDGTASFTIDTANQIEINLQPTAQAAMHYTFVRTA